jgi:hypothetical protein
LGKKVKKCADMNLFNGEAGILKIYGMGNADGGTVSKVEMPRSQVQRRQI